jgi:hypothetical protein
MSATHGEMSQLMLLDYDVLVVYFDGFRWLICKGSNESR